MTEPVANLLPYEIAVLNGAVAALEPDEAEGGAMYLRAQELGHEWIIESEAGQVYIEVVDPDGYSNRWGWLPVSDRVRRFANLVDMHDLVLSVADDRTIIASDGSMSAAIDLVPRHSGEPQPLMVEPVASITVPLQRFVLLLMAARTLPSGLSESSAPTPPVWMQIDSGWLGLHVDWTQFGVARATYRLMSLHDEGSALVSIPHRLAEAFLRALPPFDPDSGEEVDLMVTVGTVGDEENLRKVVAFESHGARCVLWVTHPLEERWGHDVDGILAGDPHLTVVESSDTERLVSTERGEAHITLHHGQPDVVRISAIAAVVPGESLELLRELSQLNAASSGARFWLNKELVRVSVDVRCTDLAALRPAIHEVVDVAAEFGPMLSALAGCVS